MKRNTNCEVSIKMLFAFHDLTYSAGHHEPLTLSGSVDEGGVLVVRGPSGAGKSTLLRILARLQAASRGIASLDGRSWLDIPSPAWRAWVHYVAQKPALFEGSVAENLAKPFSIRVLNQNALDTGHAQALMEALKLPAGLWEQDARTLSGGEASRVAFVRALLIEPKLLLLDEPTAALDGTARTALYTVLADWLKEPHHAAVLVSHTDDYLELPGLQFLDLPA